MNTEIPPYQLELVETALEALEKLTGIKGRHRRAGPNQNNGYTPNCVLELRLDELRIELACEIKTNVDRRTVLAQINAQMGPYDGAGILITPYLTRAMIDHCQELKLQFLDANGNAFINQPGMYVLIKGQKNAQRAHLDPPRIRAWNPTELKITFALLCHRDYRNATYRELTKAATVALGAVGRTYEGLIQRGYIAHHNAMERTIILEPDKIIDDWVANYPIKLRRRLGLGRFRVDDPNWWQGAELPPNVAWGGEIAAAKLTHNLKPATQTLYINEDPENMILRDLVKTFRFKRDPNGTVEVLRKFWNFEPENTPPGVVPTLLIYADLMATLNPRNIEIAIQIRDEHLRNADD